MTAREFLAKAGFEDSEHNLWELGRWFGNEVNVDFSQFPDANVPNTYDMDENVRMFQEHMEGPQF